MSAGCTVYGLNADSLGQISATPGAPVTKPTFAAAVAIADRTGIVHELDGVNSTSATCAVTSSGGTYGQLLIVPCKADASGTVTYTFGSGFKSTGTAAPTAGKTIVVAFISDGTNFFEFARSASAITD